MKYVLHPGYVISKNDGDRHYISARQLAELYNVNPAECIVVTNDEPFMHCGNDYTHLKPRYDGNYKEPL